MQKLRILGIGNFMILTKRPMETPNKRLGNGNKSHNPTPVQLRHCENAPCIKRGRAKSKILSDNSEMMLKSLLLVLSEAFKLPQKHTKVAVSKADSRCKSLNKGIQSKTIPIPKGQDNLINGIILFN